VLTPEEWEVLGLSLRVALTCVVLTLPPAVGMGWLLARRDFPGKMLLDGLCHLPLVLPPVVTGYLLLLAFGRRGWFGPLLDSLGLTLSFDWKGAALASAVVAFPLALRAVRLAIEEVDPRLEGAARTLGAGPGRVFLTITLRLAAPGLLVGALLAFARSLGEFGATITFVANIAGQTRTIPSAIYTLLNQPGGEAGALRLVVVSLLVSLAALVASEWAARRHRAR
jgi:molybdate transport system permease protein